jgi:chaperone modulatory protein CbpM
MMRLDAIVALFPDLEAAELSAWVEQRWIQPEAAEGGWLFHEIDVARVRLIYDLRRDLGVEEDMMPLVLSLLDQVYELRCTLKAMTRALERQPPEVQAAVLAALGEGEGET